MLTYALDFTKYRNLAFWLATFLLLSLVCLRGVVGTDTYNYLTIIDLIKNEVSVSGVESGFVLLIKILLFFTTNKMNIMAIIALLISVLMFVASKKSSRSYSVFLLCIVPVFYFDMTMNGIRYGLSFSLAMLAFSMFYKDRLKLSMILAFASVTFHVSALFLYMIGAFLSDTRSEFFLWIKIVLISILGILFQFYFVELKSFFGSLIGFDQYNVISNGIVTFNNSHGMSILNLVNKLFFYLTFKSPKWYSGISTLAISLIALTNISFSNGKSEVLKPKQSIIILFLVIMAFLMTKFSYAGLRIQYVILFAIFLTMQFKMSLEGLLANKKNLLWVGSLGIIFFLYHAIQTQNQGQSPFLPYVINSDFIDILH